MDRLVVSFLNTGIDGALDSPLRAAQWWASVQSTLDGLRVYAGGKPRFNPALLLELKRVREAVARARDGEKLEVRFAGDPAVDALIFPLLHAATALFGSERAKRLKTCAHAQCSRYFLDETKNGSRRWCSLRCMERARAPRRRTIAG